ncbi:MAG: hypothetical protein LUI12_12635 [Clostridiales bacterium]|nr:hypothetical protein [Clostridiales bacterium]
MGEVNGQKQKNATNFYNKDQEMQAFCSVQIFEDRVKTVIDEDGIHTEGASITICMFLKIVIPKYQQS